MIQVTATFIDSILLYLSTLSNANEWPSCFGNLMIKFCINRQDALIWIYTDRMFVVESEGSEQGRFVDQTLNETLSVHLIDALSWTKLN